MGLMENTVSIVHSSRTAKAVNIPFLLPLMTVDVTSNSFYLFYVVDPSFNFYSEIIGFLGEW